MSTPIRPCVLESARRKKAPFYNPHYPPAVTMTDLECVAAFLCCSVFLTPAEVIADAELALADADRKLADRRASMEWFLSLRAGDRLGWRYQYGTATQAWIDEWLTKVRQQVADAQVVRDAAATALAALTGTAERSAAA